MFFTSSNAEIHDFELINNIEELTSYLIKCEQDFRQELQLEKEGKIVTHEELIVFLKNLDQKTRQLFESKARLKNLAKGKIFLKDLISFNSEFRNQIMDRHTAIAHISSSIPLENLKSCSPEQRKILLGPLFRQVRRLVDRDIPLLTLKLEFMKKWVDNAQNILELISLADVNTSGNDGPLLLEKLKQNEIFEELIEHFETIRSLVKDLKLPLLQFLTLEKEKQQEVLNKKEIIENLDAYGFDAAALFALQVDDRNQLLLLEIFDIDEIVEKLTYTVQDYLDLSMGVRKLVAKHHQQLISLSMSYDELKEYTEDELNIIIQDSASPEAENLRLLHSFTKLSCA